MNLFAEITIVCGSIFVLVLGIALFSEKQQRSTPFTYAVEVIDGCEYLRFHTHYHDAITHKGNCKNH